MGKAYHTVGASIERLMASIVKAQVMRDGEPEIKRERLLGGTAETVKLRFPGYDIYFVEDERRARAGCKPPARDPDTAYRRLSKLVRRIAPFRDISHDR